MADQNPFQPPSEKPPSDVHLTDRERLALPESARARHAFGDRYFWPLVVLLGAFIVVFGMVILPWVGAPFSAFSLLAVFLLIRGLIGWVRREGD